MKRYKIGEIARFLGTTTQALRFYEQEGIIVPEKTENGTRTYSETDIVRLMAFKRFRLMDFSVQDVAAHFKKGSVDALIDTMGQRREALLRKCEELKRRAQSIENFETVLRLAQEHIDEMTCMVRPDVYAHSCCLAQVDALGGREKEAFEQFMNAMPDSHICFVYDGQQEKPLRFYFAVTEKEAREWSLPLQDTLCFRGCKCVRIFVRTDGRLWQKEYLEEQIKRVEAAGYTADRTSPLLGQQLASESGGKMGYLLAALYVPVL